MYHAPIAPEACPALVLNADFRPLSYYPLSLWSWQDSLKAVFLDRVNIVSEYERVVRSPTTEFRLPSAVSHGQTSGHHPNHNTGIENDPAETR